MHRKDFLKGLLASAIIQSSIIKNNKEFIKIFIAQSFVAGFQYYEGVSSLNSMKIGDALVLIREPENAHDDNAIALFWQNKKIGYVPRDVNIVLSALLDANDLDLMSEITFLEKNVESWECVSFAISYLKEKKHNEVIPSHLISPTMPHCETKYNEEDWDGKNVSLNDFFESGSSVLKIKEFPKRLKDQKKLALQKNLVKDAHGELYAVYRYAETLDFMYDIYAAEWFVDSNGVKYVKGIFKDNYLKS